MPFAPALAAAGLPAETLLWIRGDSAVARSWACEQALRCADVAAVLAWLPQARAADLRRLQLAAARHENLLFVFRPEAQARSASPARLRLRLRWMPVHEAEAMTWRQEAGWLDPAAGRPRNDDGGGAGHAGRMDVDVLKRRGPPLASPLALPARGERLATLLRAALGRHRQREVSGHAEAGGATRAAAAGQADPRAPALEGGPSDAMDRIAVAA